MKTLTMEEKKRYHDHIIKFADYADAMIEAIEHTKGDAELQLQLAAPVVEQTTQMVSRLSDAFLDIVESGREPTPRDIRIFESEIRKLFSSIITTTQKVQKISSVN